MIETIIAVAILGLVAVTFLGGVATGTKTTALTSEQAIAENLARSQLEYIKGTTYQYDVQEYPLNPSMVVPQSWTVTVNVEAVHGMDDGLQKVTVSPERHGQAVLSLFMYKTDR